MTELPAVAVVDIDGVVADVRHRLRHVQSRPKDWEAFFAQAPQDAPLAEGRSALEAAVAEGLGIVYLTGRPERCRASTEYWLAEHGFPAGPIHMREDRDRRPARQFKVDVLRLLSRDHAVARVIDDDAAVIAAVSAAGFPTVHATWMPETRAEQGALFDAQESDGRT